MFGENLANHGKRKEEDSEKHRKIVREEALQKKKMETIKKTIEESNYGRRNGSEAKRSQPPPVLHLTIARWNIKKKKKKVSEQTTTYMYIT